jgi:hypothetical protein
MRIKALLAVTLAFSTLVLALAGSGGASPKTQLYKFHLAGKLHAEWLWPVNPYNHGNRDDAAFDIRSGSGCGASPNKAIWNVLEQTAGVPANTLQIDLIHVPKNPALVVDSNYAGSPTASVKISLRFPKSAKLPLTMIAKPQGDVASLTLSPRTAKLTATKVGHC